jgi:hypothetical protein
MLAIPHCLDNRLTYGDEVNLTHRRVLLTRNIIFLRLVLICVRRSLTLGHSTAGLDKL